MAGRAQGAAGGREGVDTPHDELAREREQLPWVPIEKEYSFDTDDGAKTLAELFDGRSQLLVYYFMFGPEYEAGCSVCSSSADTVNGAVPHLNARDVTIVYVARAPLEKLRAYKRRMGWSFPWVSSYRRSAGLHHLGRLLFRHRDAEIEAEIALVLPSAGQIRLDT